MVMYKRIAKPVSYDASKKRNRKDIKYIVIHYTGLKGDTAKNNVDYFATGNTREAGAHFFVDRQGKIARSIPMNRTAWSVGGFYNNRDGAGSYYQKCTNYNSVSIELCDNYNCLPSTAQKAAVKKLVKYIRKHCKNVKTIIRHWDVNGKQCPAKMIGFDNKDWLRFLKEIN